MTQVVGYAVLAAALTVVVGVALGRLQARARCALADARRDVRMRAAFDEGNEGRPGGARTS